jgi:uncharacterized membrane protein
MRTTREGHVAFAVVMIALGIQGLIKRDFTPVWQPVPRGVPAREALVYVCAVVSLTSGLGLLWTRTATLAARVLFALLLLWLLLFRVRAIVRAPSAFGAWDGAAETAVMVAGAWLLFAAGDASVRIARGLYGVALVPFGLAHFLYLKQTATLVPAWLPAHVAWAYFTGGAFLAAGVAVLVGEYARLAAALSALQIGLFTVLVWVPIIAAGSKDAYQWSEFVLSTALTAGAWVVADSYR